MPAKQARTPLESGARFKGVRSTVSSLDRRNLLKYLTGAVAGIGATIASLPFIKSMNPSERAKTNRHLHIDVNIEKLKEGQILSVRDTLRPILILRRSHETLTELAKNNSNLADPHSMESVQPESSKNIYRSLRPDILVVENICTHLGCAVAYSPKDGEKEYFSEGGFFCPCHGSTYDHAGRVHKNMPAPTNLTIPKYEMIDENTIRVEIENSF